MGFQQSSPDTDKSNTANNLIEVTLFPIKAYDHMAT